MPQLGETVTEGTIIRWMKQVGDEIAYDEPLFEVSTDKVDSEVPSPASGYLAEILVAEGRDGRRRHQAGRRHRRGPLRLPPAPIRPARASVRAARPRPPRPSAPVAETQRPMPEPAAAQDGRGRTGEPVERQGAGAVSRRPPTRRGARHRPRLGAGHRQGGRITRADVLAFIDRHAAGAGAAGAATPARSGPA